MWDAVIIGAGVTGSAIARELSRRKGKFCVIEKESDVCSGTSKANSAIVHAGFDAETGSNKAIFNVHGNQMMDQISEELDVPFRRNGAFVVCLNEEELPALRALYERGLQNGVKELRLLSREEAVEMEPNLSDAVVGALYAPTSGIVCPFELTMGFAENAAKNGVEFRLDTAVTKIEKTTFGWRVITENGELETRAVVNAAGVYADVFHNMVSRETLTITPRRGDYCLLDKTAGHHVERTIFQLPGKLGKGILVTPTVHGNLLVGPTAVDVEDKEATATTAAGIADLTEKSALAVRNVPMRQVITSFAGLRAHDDRGDFVLGEPDDAPYFFDAAGIESPGLTSAPAIGEYIATLVTERLGLEKNEDFNPIRRGVFHPSSLSFEERAEFIRFHPAYGRMICRCEGMSEGEILDAIHRPLGATTVDGVKRRTRAGMGRCQGGFCSPRVMEILARELHVDLTEIRKADRGSEIAVGQTDKGLPEAAEWKE